MPPIFTLGYCDPPKGTSLWQTASFEPSNVKICQSVWAVEVSKDRVGKGRFKREKSTICHTIGESLSVNRFQPNLAISHVKLDPQRCYFCQFWSQSFDGFNVHFVQGCSNIWSPHSNRWWPLQQGCTAVQPVIIIMIIITHEFLVRILHCCPAMHYKVSIVVLI